MAVDTVRMKLADLKSPEKNFRVHDENQITEFCRSVAMFGQIRPIVVDEDNTVLAGNGLYAALKQMGWPDADCYIVPGLTERQKKKLMIADNRIFDLGRNDLHALDAFIIGLNDDLDIPGFDEDILRSAVFEGGDEIISRYSLDTQKHIGGINNNQPNYNGAMPHGGRGADNSSDGDEQDSAYEPEGYIESDGADDAPNVPEVPMSKPGDLWRMGGHRLICGDAADRGTVSRLMGGSKAQCIFTDPPYGVSYFSQSGKFGIIKNDDMRGDDLMANLLIPAFKNLVEFSDDGAAFYIWHASTTRRDFEDAMTAVGLVERQYLIWVKNGFQMGHADYHWGHEPCYYAQKSGQSIKFYGDRTNQTVWKAALRASRGVEATVTGGIMITDGSGGRIYISNKPPKGKRIRSIRARGQDSILLYSEGRASTAWEVSKDAATEHPTQKPVELAVKAIKNSTMAGDITLDLFGGSGTTLIGAELTGRAAYITELDPKYCDVIINRYIKITGNKGIHCTRDGRDISYAAVKKEYEAALKRERQSY